jgi:signal transduction histidine kinase
MRRLAGPSSTAATATMQPPDDPMDLPPGSRWPGSGSDAEALAQLARYRAEDHDRIARGLNDVVVHRMFAAGIDLQAALSLVGDHPAASRISRAVDQLDRAIRDIRDVVYDHQPDH